MPLRVIGAGLGRTGTHSLKLALESLLGGPCYHMVEVFEHPEHIPTWHSAAKGEPVDWEGMLAGYVAAVDWPPCAFWPELIERNPDAVVILSTRSAESWWTSASTTIFPAIERQSTNDPQWYAMVMEMFARHFTVELEDKEACIQAFHRHNERVTQLVPRNQLVVWEAREGWPKICNALGVPIPNEPFPLTNTTSDFLAQMAKATSGQSS